MASSGKKGKKSKGKVISLQSFLSTGDAQPGVTQVAKKIRQRGSNESDEEDTLPQIYQLPTAPRASRIFDDDSVPHRPPFLAYISNLPFDVNEEDIYEFFEIPIISLRLPREDGESGRVRGFGYIEFDTRDDLIHAISLPDPQIKNRRIRIDISNENEQQQGQKRGQNNRSRYDGFGNSENRENRESTNWRRDTDNNRDEDRRGGYDRNRGYNRDRPNRDGSPETGSWRTAERSNVDNSPRRGGYNSEKYRGGEFSARRQNEDFKRIGNRSDDDMPQERPRLNLKPRTLPLPEIVRKPEEVDECEPEIELKSGIPAEKVFGAAKPVDTAAKEREIEERLEKERLQQIEHIKDEENNLNEKLAEVEIGKEDKENKNNSVGNWRRRDEDSRSADRQLTYSPDRRTTGPRRNDDRRQGHNRDQRSNDYNRGGSDRDNKEYNRERSERNEQDNCNREQGHSRDEKPKRETRPDKLSKLQAPSTVQALQTSNKYSGLLDDEDGSE